MLDRDSGLLRGTLDVLILKALSWARDFFHRYNRQPSGVRSILGAHPA